MAENYRGYELNQKDDPAWAQRENTLHKDLIDTTFDKMEWKGIWDNTAHITNDVIRDGDWTMVANTDTTDRPAPQPNGDAKYTIDTDVPPWTSDTSISVVESGQLYEFSESGWIREIRIWVPEISNTTHYRIILKNETNPLISIYNIIENPILFENQWSAVAIGNQLVKSGSKLRIILDAINSGADTNISGRWTYVGDSTSEPAIGGWNRDKHDILKFNKTDLDSGDRSAELLSITPDSTIRCIQTSDPSKGWEYLVLESPIDQGTYVEYVVTRILNIGNIGNNEATTVDINIPIPQSTQYVTEADYWTTHQPTFATVSGFLEYDGVATGVSSSAYGVDLLFQSASISADWDVLAVSNLSGGSSPSTIKTLDNTRYVAVNGDDEHGTGSIANPYATISHTLTTITDASLSNPYNIQLASGIFIESDTIQCKDYVFITGMGASTIITTSNQNVDLFNLALNASLINLTVQGPSNARALSLTSPNKSCTFRAVVLLNCNDGIYINGVNCNISAFDTYVITIGAVSFNKVFEVLEGHLDIQGVYVRSGTQANTLLTFNGANAGGHIWTIDNDAADIDRYVDIQNGANVTLNNCRTTGGDTSIYLNNASLTTNNMSITDANIGIDVGPDGFSILNINSTSVVNSTTYDLRVQNTSSVLMGIGNYLKDSKINFPNGAPGNGSSYAMSHFSNDAGDEAFIIKSELAVGAPDRPSESAFGEGDSYTRGMIVYTYDTINGYIDETEAAKSFNESTFGFSDVTIDSAIYACSTLKNNGDVINHYGIKLKIAIAGVNGTGTAITEYWDGGAWIPFNIMRTEGNSPFLPKIGSLIEATAGIYQLRYDALIDINWVKNDPMSLGTDYFWTRIRITSPITTSLTIEQFKLHSNRTEFNGDGWLEYFGRARPIGRLAWNYGMLEAASSSPSNQDIYISDNIDVGMRENLFANNATDRIGLLAPIPFDTDISTPIRMRWAIRSTTNTGNIDWVVRWGHTRSGDITYTSSSSAPDTHPTEQTINLVQASPATTGTIEWNVVDIDIVNVNPRNADGTSDILWVTIERDGGGDSSSGAVTLIALSADYLKWTEGGHL